MNPLHARQELLAAGDLLLIGKLGLGKTGLVGHAAQFRKPSAPRLHQSPQNQKLNQRLPNFILLNQESDEGPWVIEV
jgi:hypothetical protein